MSRIYISVIECELELLVLTLWVFLPGPQYVASTRMCVCVCVCVWCGSFRAPGPVMCALALSPGSVCGHLIAIII